MDRRRCREAKLTAYRASQVSFQLNNAPLERVNTFLYLGCIMAFNNSDWPALYRQLKRAQQRWAMIVRVLDKEGASPRAKGLFYKTIVQAVLLYGCETWTLTDTMYKVLDSFHHKVARRITNSMPKLVGGEWVYPSLAKAMKDAGLHSIRTYVFRWQHHIMQFVSTRPVFQLCQEAARRSGSARWMRWLDQNFEGAPVDPYAAK
jgi:hypothetical protein